MASEDPFIKGVEEWIQFAEVVSFYLFLFAILYTVLPPFPRDFFPFYHFYSTISIEKWALRIYIC